MTVRLRKKHAVFAMIAVVGAALVAAEAYAISPAVRVRAVSGMAAVGADGMLVNALTDGSGQVRAASAEALNRRGAAAVPTLVAGLEGSDAQVRHECASVLALIGPRAREAVPALRRARADADTSVRTAANGAYYSVGRDDPAVRADLIGDLATADKNGRAAALAAMQSIGDREFVPALGKALRDPDDGVKNQAAEALGGFGAAAAPAVPDLIAALADPAVGEEAEEALSAIAGALGSEQAELRGRIAAELERAAKR